MSRLVGPSWCAVAASRERGWTRPFSRGGRRGAWEERAIASAEDIAAERLGAWGRTAAGSALAKRGAHRPARLRSCFAEKRGRSLALRSLQNARRARLCPAGFGRASVMGADARTFGRRAAECESLALPPCPPVLGPLAGTRRNRFVFHRNRRAVRENRLDFLQGLGEGKR